MTKINYNFAITGDLVNSVKDYIELVRTGVNLTDDYLGIYPEIEKVNDIRVLNFDIEIPADPTKHTIQTKFLNEFLRRFDYDFRINKAEVTVITTLLD